MPTYEFACPACSHEFETFRFMADTSPEPCEKCGYKRTEKIISTPMIRGDITDWSNENGGKGRYCVQKAQRPNDPNGYCRSRSDLEGWAKKKGYTVEKEW